MTRPSSGRGWRASNRRAGFEYYPATRTAHFEVYEPGARRKRRLTLHDVETRERAEKLWTEFKEKVKGRAKHVHLVAPNFARIRR